MQYLDFYRPHYFVLENVRNFAMFKKSLILKLCLLTLLKLGYQFTFGVLQAGHHGMAQSRRRCFILASAPSYNLPLFPEPRTAFDNNLLKVIINKKEYVNNCTWKNCAPYRSITIKDVISDLPQLQNVNQKQNEMMKYDKDPESHYQKKMRKNSSQLFDHICKKMSNFDLKRISLIPKKPGADWRDLPNVEITLNNSEILHKLEYTYQNKRNGQRGVCECVGNSSKTECKMDKQKRTTIPWFLVHTADRNNHFSGCYGRLSWNGIFQTIITDPGMH